MQQSECMHAYNIYRNIGRRVTFMLQSISTIQRKLIIIILLLLYIDTSK